VAQQTRFKSGRHQHETAVASGRPIGIGVNPAGGANSAPPPPDPLAGLRGPTSNGRGGEGGVGVRWGGEKGRGRSSPQY